MYPPPLSILYRNRYIVYLELYRIVSLYTVKYKDIIFWKEMQEFQENLEGETEGEPVNGVNEMTFTLKRSGKTIRRLSAGNPQLYT